MSGSRAASQLAPGYSSTRGLTQIVVAALALVALLELVSIVSDFAEIRLLTRAINGELVTRNEAQSSDDRQQLLAIATLIATIGTGVVFLAWMHRSYRNLPALRASGLKFSPGWAVGAWFVPFLNFWRPYEITAEMSRASHPDYVGDDADAWPAAPLPPYLGVWWAMWILGGVVGWILVRLVLQRPDDLDGIRVQSTFLLIGDGISLIAAGLAIAVVLGIANGQEDKRRRLVSTSSAPWAGPQMDAQRPVATASREVVHQRDQSRPRAGTDGRSTCVSCGRAQRPGWRHCPYCMA